MKCLRTSLLLVLLSMSAQPVLSQTINHPGYFYDEYITGVSFHTTMAMIAENDFLILNQKNGKVRRFIDGVFVGDVLDLPVAGGNHRGLIGICLDPDFNLNGRVYLFYSYALQDGGAWIENRAERFIWNGATLTSDMILLTIPYDPDQNNSEIMQGGILGIGPDKKLYVSVGCLGRGTFDNPRIEQNTGGTNVAGAGAIYRLNLDGTIPSDNPFVGESNHYLRAIYVYGLRNCFGHTFDPLTGRFWMTENGPEVYDEINTFLPGANSGWRKIMGPDYRNAQFFDNNYTSYNASDLVYLPGAHYQDPVFSVLPTSGFTSITFIHSHKYSAPLRDSALVGESVGLRLYLYELTENRDDFVLEGLLTDRVADTDEEKNLSQFGIGWGVVTDIKIGPDGYLYILSYTEGKVYRIRPLNDLVLAKEMLVTVGQLLSGSVEKTHYTDNQYVKLRARVGRGGEIAAQIQLSSSAPPPTSVKTLNELAFKTSVKTSKILIQEIHLYNNNTSEWELVSTGLTSTSDKVTTLTVNSNISRFVNPTTGEVKAQISWKALASAIGFPPEINVDEATWTFKYN